MSLHNTCKHAWFERREAGVYLEVRAGDTGCDLFEERLLHPDELRWFDHIQDLLNLPQEHHLITRMEDGKDIHMSPSE